MKNKEKKKYYIIIDILIHDLGELLAD